MIEYCNNSVNTGSREARLITLHYKIINLANHLKNNKKDKNSRRALLTLMSKKVRLMRDYKECFSIDLSDGLKYE